MDLPLLLHPSAALVGLVVGLPLGRFLALGVQRFSYDDEFFDPERGPRTSSHVHLSDLEDLSFLPWPLRIPFFGELIGMVWFCHFHFLLPPPACEDCGHPWTPGERIPLVSHLRLGGRCPHCAAPLSVQAFWIEALTPLLLATLGAVHGLTLETLLYWILAGLCVVATVVDWDFQIIPDEVPTTGLGVGVGVGLAHTLYGLATSGWPPGPLQEALLDPVLVAPWHLAWCLGGGLLGGLVLWGLQKLGTWLAGTNAMGCGDVKLAVALGLFLGPLGSLISLFYAAVFGAICGVGVKLLGRGKREQGYTKFAFGPFICLGTLLVVFVGPDLAVDLYLRFSQALLGLLGLTVGGGPPPAFP